MQALSSPQLQELFATQVEADKVYRKSGTFLMRQADPGESILTIVAGKLETLKTAGADDIVLVNITIGSSAERYIIAREMFDKRYDLEAGTIRLDGFEWRMASARGKIRGFFYAGPPIFITAPWGEQMMVQAGDFIGNPVGGKASDIYRVEREAFQLTYRLED